jgi:exodeoxyribonuclease V beta subunit
VTLLADSAPFDVCGPLPSGVTVLEASAGTGKTFTIAALAARYVADGVPLRDILLVTFTRMATGELRERVRERLESAERALGAVLEGAEPGERDQVVRLLAEGGEDEVRLRHDRLARALSDFDAATITTTHGFCQEVLGGLGVACDVERDATFAEDVRDLLDEVVDDLYVRRFRRAETAPPFGRAEALELAQVAVANPEVPIEPRDADPDGVPAMRRRLAMAVRDELALRKRQAALVTYDDLLTDLKGALTGDGGPVIARRLRERYRVVLVDEFQDTDPIQWDIMRTAFGTGTLVLIGDPKQAIYAFRGADVYAYLAAARSAVAHNTLRINWRSDQGLIDAYDALFDGARLGHPEIVYRDVRAADANQAPRLTGAPSDVPLRVRVAHRDEPQIARTQGGYARNASAREYIAKDLAADVVRLLESGAAIEVRADDGTPLRTERVRPRHVAVLVRTNRQAAAVRDELDAAGVPAVINGAGSVFGTAPARDWLRLLEALERPASGPRARAAALTPFLGWDAEEVACAEEPAWEDVHRRLHAWARVLRLRGVAALAETVSVAEGLPARVLAREDGERDLTDVRHLGQLLHAAATTEQLGTTALAAWLRRRIAEAEQDSGDEERSRRLESDAEAVQVLTVHRSKGLEFPIVYFPDLWEPGYVPDKGPVVFHDPDAGDRRTVDVGLDGPGFARHRQQSLVEQRGEDLRLAYVALTRARHQAVVWWAGSWNSRHSALARLLFARDEHGTVQAEGRSTPTDAAVVARFEALAAAKPGRIAVERAVLGRPLSWSGTPREPEALTASAFDRELDRRWRRTSYSDITADAHDARVASEPEEDVTDDEPVAPAAAPASPDGDEALRALPSPLAGMPAGVEIGTFVHRVLEAVDFAAPDLGAELARVVGETRARRGLDIGDAGATVAGLRAVLETPLGPVLGGRRLCDVARADRLDELGFELPLAGGDTPSGRVALDAIGAVLREHLPPGDPLAGYAERLRDPALRRAVRGYLTGSIDLVVRVGDAYAIADYKTNWLAPPGEELTAWHHRPSVLAAEMRRAHYGLQALLYTVALHRYLRWRLPGYDPDRHLAGVLYLYLRGMGGADTPVVDGLPCGVFAWRPSGALVAALSDTLDAGGGG